MSRYDELYASDPSTQWAVSLKPSNYQTGRTYNPFYGRQQSLYRTRGLRYQQGAGLQTLYDLATGRQSSARQQTAQQQTAMKASIQAQAKGAQRGRYDPAAQRAAQQASALSTQGIAGAGKTAELKERQAAAAAYQSAADQTLSNRLALESLGRGYSQLGIMDKYKQAQAALQAQALRGDISWSEFQKRQAQEAFDAQMAGAGLSAFGSILGMGGSMGGMSDIKAKAGIKSAGQDVDAFLRALRR